MVSGSLERGVVARGEAARAGTWWRQGAREESTCAGSWTTPHDSPTLFIPCAPASSDLPATSCDFRQTRAVGRVRLSQWLGVRPISGRAKMGLKDSSSPRCDTSTSPREWSRAPHIKDEDNEEREDAPSRTSKDPAGRRRNPLVRRPISLYKDHDAIIRSPTTTCATVPPSNHAAVHDIMATVSSD